MSEDLKRMADMLKAGATMLPRQCPLCHAPLFQMGDEIWCPKCNKRVVIVSDSEEPALAAAPFVLQSLEETIINKISEAKKMIDEESDPERLESLGSLLSMWLDVLYKLRKIREK